MSEALRTIYGYSVYSYYGQEDLTSFIRKVGRCIIIIQSPCKLAKKVYAAKELLSEVKIIHVFHGTPGFELVPLQKEIISYHFRHNIELSWTFKQLCLQIGMAITSKKCFARLLRKKYALPYGKADKIVVLSKGIIAQYQSIAPDNREQFVAIPNALSFKDVEQPSIKSKEVLVVARMEDWHKRITEILKIWALLQSDSSYAEWTLRIVGDGVDKPFYEESVQKRNIPNVSFEGQQDPLTYYQNASIFMMTSACEGLPMTILEAQQCGCVPILYDSFASAKDIIDNGVNGIMITNNDRENFVQKLKELMSNPTMRHQMSKACVQSSENYSIERVAAQWNELILSL